MKADITRVTFDPERHYRSVRMQQGRVQLDADWNEQLDIDAHRIDIETVDVIGLCGAPHHPPGESRNFQIAAVAGQKDLAIAAGRIYVDGILCESEREERAALQPDFPPDAAIVQSGGSVAKRLSELADSAEDKGRYVAYLDVWSRHLSVLEAPAIREVALGGPDTATRVKTVWQVKLLKLANDASCAALPSSPAWQELVAASSGRLTAQAKKDTTASDPCVVAAEAGYRGLENQLYRVEVHRGGARNAATFKWSRENGSVATGIERMSGNDVTVQSLGKDSKLGFASGQWVEILDDGHELTGQPGELVQIDSVDPGTRVITLKTAPTPLAPTADGVDPARHPKLRRWDQTGTTADQNGVGMTAAWLALEDGIEVRFSTGTYRTGDYWLVPARTALGDIEWPRDPANPANPGEQAPRGIAHHYCPLALATFNGSDFEAVSDCRRLFPALTELTGFHYISGDGQEARPGHELPRPLQAGVANGQWPVAGRKVRFTLPSAGGKLLPGASTVVSSSATEMVVLSGADGVAECRWELDKNPASLSQQVEARLIDDLGVSYHLPLRFNANQSVAAEVAYTPRKDCKELPAQDKIPTVSALLQKGFPGWPPTDDAGNTTVKDVLDTLLCALDAWRLPYNPTVKEARWKDIREGALGSPPVPHTVQDALDELVEKLESSDIAYRPDCGVEKGPTVRALLGVPTDKDSKIDDVLDKLLCVLSAGHLPLAQNAGLCATLKKAGAQTTQDALQVLCAHLEDLLAERVRVTTGEVTFEDVTEGQARSSPPIAPGLTARFYTVLTAVELKFAAGTYVYMGDITTLQFPSLIVAYNAIDASPGFAISLRDTRPTDPNPTPISWVVRWWAVPSTQAMPSVSVPAPARGISVFGREVLASRVALKPGLTVANLAAEFGVSTEDVQAAVKEMREAGLIRVERGKLFPK